jgi:hypothetical protein
VQCSEAGEEGRKEEKERRGGIIFSKKGTREGKWGSEKS